MKCIGFVYNSRVSIGGSKNLVRCASNRRFLSSQSPEKLRILRFRIPRNAKKKDIKRQSSDRASTWEMVKTFLPHEEKHLEPPNDHEARVLNTFKLQPDKLLEIPHLKELPSPFEYHSVFNDDKSYITQPRLSVSKVLTNAWCELKSFYEVYAGSPFSKPSASMKAGTKYHAKLEVEEHPKRDVISLKSQLKELLAGHSKETVKELLRTKQAFEFAQNWIEQIIFRSICASHTKMARELYVHGFLDMNSENIVTDTANLHKGVLVNGIADIVKIDTFNADEPLDEMGSGVTTVESCSEKIPTFGSFEIMDLTIDIPRAKETMTQLSQNHYLHMRDVKTRKSNSIPSQISAVNGAKLQCMYYAVFLHNLSKDAEFGYESCLENIKRRGIDPDKPLSVALATELIIVNFKVVALDMIRLAKGEALGFQRFDEHKKSPQSYSLSEFLTEDQFRTLLSIHYGDELDISNIDLSPLFLQWSTPLTLRYVCARAGQAFNIYQAFEPSSVCIEYHNPSSKKIIARKHYPFNIDEIESSITQSCKFWNGKRRPIATDDRSVCNYCNYKKRCPAINSGFGPEAARLIKELQRKYQNRD